MTYYKYFCDFKIEYDGILYNCCDSCISIPAPDRDTSDCLIASLFSDSCFFMGAKFICSYQHF